MSIQTAEGPAHVVTGVQLDARGDVARVRWYLADGGELVRGVPRPLSGETVVDTLEVIDRLLEAEPVVPLFREQQGAQIGAVVKVHVRDDGTESIEVDPALPGRSLRDLPRL